MNAMLLCRSFLEDLFSNSYDLYVTLSVIMASRTRCDVFRNEDDRQTKVENDVLLRGRSTIYRLMAPSRSPVN